VKRKIFEVENDLLETGGGEKRKGEPGGKVGKETVRVDKHVKEKKDNQSKREGDQMTVQMGGGVLY